MSRQQMIDAIIVLFLIIVLSYITGHPV